MESSLTYKEKFKQLCNERNLSFHYMSKLNGGFSESPQWFTYLTVDNIHFSSNKNKSKNESEEDCSRKAFDYFVLNKDRNDGKLYYNINEIENLRNTLNNPIVDILDKLSNDIILVDNNSIKHNKIKESFIQFKSNIYNIIIADNIYHIFYLVGNLNSTEKSYDNIIIVSDNEDVKFIHNFVNNVNISIKSSKDLQLF